MIEYSKGYGTILKVSCSSLRKKHIIRNNVFTMIIISGVKDISKLISEPECRKIYFRKNGVYFSSSVYKHNRFVNYTLRNYTLRNY